MSDTSFDQHMLDQINNVIGNFVRAEPPSAPIHTIVDIAGEFAPLISSPVMYNGDLINDIIDSFVASPTEQIVIDSVPFIAPVKVKAPRKTKKLTDCSLPIKKTVKKEKLPSTQEVVEKEKEAVSFIPHIDMIKIDHDFLNDPRIKNAACTFSDARIMGAGPINILVVGCGGTGSRLIELLAQAKMFKYRNVIGHIVICDMDKV